MKKTTIILFSGVSAMNLFSQTNKGQFLIGTGIGSAGSTTSESSTSYSNTPTIYNSKGNSTSWNLNPTIGWFAIKNLAVGSYISIGGYKSTSTSSNTSSSTTTESEYKSPSWYIGPFARYYFGGAGKGQPFVHASYQMGVAGSNSISRTSTGASSETKAKPKSNNSTSFGAGYEQFLSSMVGVFFMVNYNISNSKTTYEYRPSSGTGYDYTSSYKSTNIGFSIGLQIHLNSFTPKK
ncbi:MAG: hypothetical protein JNL57_03590 [Bacteroidetes bacterium]|nr:hypothetical protein [Bacteroidota bacterium]